MVSERKGILFAVGAFTIRDGRIIELDFLVDPERVAKIDLRVLEDAAGAE
jgi:RNA polymerase sigma-70 factor (ECF subfamily)